MTEPTRVALSVSLSAIAHFTLPGRVDNVLHPSRSSRIEGDSEVKRARPLPNLFAQAGAGKVSKERRINNCRIVAFRSAKDDTN